MQCMFYVTVKFKHVVLVIDPRLIDTFFNTGKTFLPPPQKKKIIKMRNMNLIGIIIKAKLSGNPNLMYVKSLRLSITCIKFSLHYL